MNVTDTKPSYKSCSKCGITKIESLFIPKRNICKECRNKKSREKYSEMQLNNIIETKQNCNNCDEEKLISGFHKGRKICCDCINKKRREKYDNNEEHRKKLIKMASEFKHNKVIERQKIKEEEIGKENKKCNYCEEIKHNSCFRYNRLKCRICERDEPIDKFKRIIRSRIYASLKNKNMKTIEYLGCTNNEYLKWILSINKDYTLDNRGEEWHIDHVIPISKFDLDNDEEVKIAFNWRNTMPLSPKDNLSKNNKIIKEQIENHYKTLIKYHIENKLDLPQVFIDLFAKHLDAGKPLEPSLPLTTGNICEELG
jgi:hypothetical protein